MHNVQFTTWENKDSVLSKVTLAMQWVHAYKLWECWRCHCHALQLWKRSQIHLADVGLNMHGVMLPLCISSKAMIIAMVLCCQLKTNKFWPITGPNCVKWRWWTWFSQRVMSIMLHRPQLSVFSRTSHPPLSLKMHIFLFPLFVCCHWPSCAPPPRPCLIFHGWAGGGSASDHISPLAGLPISQPPSQLPRTILRTTAPTVKVWVCPRASSSSSLSSLGPLPPYGRRT